MTLNLAFVASTRPWQQRLNRVLHAYSIDVALLTIIADPRDLFLAVEGPDGEQDWQVLLIDAASTWLSEDLVSRIHDNGRGVVAVVEPGDDRRRDRALSFGVDHPLESDADLAELVTVVSAVAGNRHLAPHWPRTAAGPPRSRPAVAPSGQIIAVGGPPGSHPERVALALAAVLAKDDDVVVVDANDLDPSLAPRLGLHPQPNLPDVVARVMANRGEGVVEDLQEVPTGGFWALPGMVSARTQWNTVGPNGLRRLLDRLARTHGRVVVITGPAPENIPRFAVTLTVLAAASDVVAVGEASLVGLDGLYQWVADATQVTTARLWPVASYVRTTRRGSDDVLRHMEKLADLAGADTVMLVPAPGRQENKGRWDGQLYRDGKLMREARRLAGAVTT